MLVELGVDDVAVCDALMRQGILVRGGSEFGLPGIARVTVGPRFRHASHRCCDRRSRGRSKVTGVLVADRIIELLGREGAEHIVGFPENRLLNSAAAAGMRPIITRTERVAVNIADGFARATNGERLLPCVSQYGPGAEAAFAAVAQAYGDRSPILLLPSEHAVAAQEDPQVRSELSYRPITRFLATLNDAARGPEVFRRALNAVRGDRNGPVLVAIANDVLNGAAGEADWNVPTSLPRLSQANPADVEQTAKALLAAEHPVIVAGQGVLYAGATAELLALAERTGTPVATTLNGKSAFPEDHPLALGTAARTRPATVNEFFEQADLVLGIGTSFTRSLYITPMPRGATFGQITDDRRDLATGYDVSFGCIGDARLVLLQLLDALGEGQALGAPLPRLRSQRCARRSRSAGCRSSPRMPPRSAPTASSGS